MGRSCKSAKEAFNTFLAADVAVNADRIRRFGGNVKACLAAS